MSLAFTVNATLNRSVWRGLLAEDGESQVPKLLTDFIAVFVYLVAVMIVMHFVYDEPITADRRGTCPHQVLTAEGVLGRSRRTGPTRSAYCRRLRIT